MKSDKSYNTKSEKVKIVEFEVGNRLSTKQMEEFR